MYNLKLHFYMSRRLMAGGVPGVMAILALAACGCARAAAPYYDSEVMLTHDDNVGRAARSLDILDDNIASLGVTGNWPRSLDERSGLLLAAGLHYHRYTRWEDLSHLLLDGGATYRFKPQPAYTSPWYELAFAASLQQHQDSVLRDGAIARVELSAGKRLTDRLQWRGGYQLSVRRAWEGRVFDTGEHRLYAHADLRLGEALTLYATFGWHTGDTVSTATPSARIRAVSLADAADGALGNRTAYRLDADTLDGEIGLNLAVTRTLAVDVSALHFSTDGEGGNDYDGTLLRAAVLYRF